MKKRYLGRGRLGVSAMGLGCFAMVGDYGQADETECIATIHQALELGVNFFDTSDGYGWGKNEELVGRALKGKRQKAIVATKFGNLVSEDGRLLGVNGRPEYVEQACNASLKRLGMDYVDLYYLHRLDPNTPIEDTVGAMADLVKTGKVRYIGLSEVSSRTLRRANAVHPITVLQTEYSLWSRDVEADNLPACRDLDIGFIAYAPLGRGFLTGQIRSEASLGQGDRRPIYPRFQGENLRKNLEAIRVLEDIARTKGCTPAQLALAWVFARGEDIVPIPGTKNRKHLKDNTKALDIRLTDSDVNQLNVVAANVAGERYPEAMMKKVNL